MGGHPLPKLIDHETTPIKLATVNKFMTLFVGGHSKLFSAGKFSITKSDLSSPKCRGEPKFKTKSIFVMVSLMPIVSS